MNIEISEDKAANNIFAAFVKGLRNYFNFKGRTCRYDYWGFMFVSGLISFCLILLEEVNPAMFLVSLVYGLLVLIPSIFIFVRRMHDINRSFFKWGVLPLILVALPFIYFYFSVPNLEARSYMFILIGIPSIIALYGWGIVLLVWCCFKGNTENNKYGLPIVETEKQDKTARWMIFFVIALWIISAVVENVIRTSSYNHLLNDIKVKPAQVQNTDNREVENVPSLSEQKAEAEESSNQEQVLEPVQVQSENASEEVAEVKDTHSETEE